MLAIKGAAPQGNGCTGCEFQGVKDCYGMCVCLYVSTNRIVDNCEEKRHPSCPVVGFIPDKHGDLKDADLIIKELRKEAMVFWGKDDFKYQVIMDVLQAVRNAPVVLEESK